MRSGRGRVDVGVWERVGVGEWAGVVMDHSHRSVCRGHISTHLRKLMLTLLSGVPSQYTAEAAAAGLDHEEAEGEQEDEVEHDVGSTVAAPVLVPLPPAVFMMVVMVVIHLFLLHRLRSVTLPHWHSLGFIQNHWVHFGGSVGWDASMCAEELLLAFNHLLNPHTTLLHHVHEPRLLLGHDCLVARHHLPHLLRRGAMALDHHNHPLSAMRQWGKHHPGVRVRVLAASMVGPAVVVGPTVMVGSTVMMGSTMMVGSTMVVTVMAFMVVMGELFRRLLLRLFSCLLHLLCLRNLLGFIGLLLLLALQFLEKLLVPVRETLHQQRLLLPLLHHNTLGAALRDSHSFLRRGRGDKAQGSDDNDCLHACFAW